MVVPALSNDYKLPILIPGVAILLETLKPPPQDFRPWVWQTLLVFILATAYGFTFYSFVIKTGILANNLPVYMIMLIATTLLALMPWQAEPAPGIDATAELA
jgi:high-affinity Fe2+/Pb2+ permease